MVDCYPAVFSLVLACLVCVSDAISDASAGDADLHYRTCIQECERSGCVGQQCFPHCKFFLDIDGPWYMQEPLYLKWKQRNCQTDCRYYCMIEAEKKREGLGFGPVKYHGKWPFKQVFGIQEPVSVAVSMLNLAMHFHGWLSFFILVYYKLPMKPDKNVHYEYASFWHIYAFLSMNSWFWSAIFHSRDVGLTEILDYSSAVALIGYSLILAIVRSFNLTADAARVIVAAPLLAFVITHILFINLYTLDYVWNKKVCAVMTAIQVVLWATWAGVIRHPSRWKLWVAVVGGGLVMLLEIYDFPPYQGFVDAHALRHAITIPLTFIWWSFIRGDAVFRTSNLLEKEKGN